MSRLKKLSFVLLASTLAILVALGVVEAAVRGLGLDTRRMGAVLYYQNHDVDLYVESADPVSLYEMRPGARAERTGPFGAYTASVNRFGERGGPREAEPPAGTTRILFLGASTIHGFGVNDAQTIPAVLEGLLNTRHPGRRFEVWNLGHSGYVESQIARLGRRALAGIPGVSMVVLMATNGGRRPFLGTVRDHPGAAWSAFEAEPLTWLENFPVPPAPGLSPARAAGLHLWSLRHLALYRYLAAERLGRIRQQPRSPWAEALGRREMGALVEEAAARGVHLFYTELPNRGGVAPAPRFGAVMEVLDLNRAGQAVIMEERHPPPAILAQHATHLAEALEASPAFPLDPAP